MGIDDYDVEHAQQEHAVQKIKSAGQSVCLTVQPIPELTELSVRSPDGNETYLLRIGPIKFNHSKQEIHELKPTGPGLGLKKLRNLGPKNFSSLEKFEISDQVELAVRGSLGRFHDQIK